MISLIGSSSSNRPIHFSCLNNVLLVKISIICHGIIKLVADYGEHYLIVLFLILLFTGLGLAILRLKEKLSAPDN